MRPSPLRLSLLLLALLLLAACQSHEGRAAAVETPEAAVRQSVARIRAGDFDGFWRHALPPHDYAMLRADWGKPRIDETPMTEGQRARIDATLRQIAAPDAEAVLGAQLQPWLAETKARYGDQLPILVAVGRALATGAIDAAPGLTEAQKHNAAALLQSLTPWAQQAPWFDPANAREAISVAVATARQLDVHDAQSLRTGDFDQAMGRYATAFAGLKRVLDLYGLPLDSVLASARVVPLDYHPPYARVRVESHLAGAPLAVELTLVQQDGHWYDQDLIESVHRAHRHLASPGDGAAPSAATAR